MFACVRKKEEFAFFLYIKILANNTHIFLPSSIKRRARQRESLIYNIYTKRIVDI